MRKALRIGVFFLGLGVVTAGAEGQSLRRTALGTGQPIGQPQTQMQDGVAAQGMRGVSNPYLNPVMNPYLNPYLSTSQMSSEASLLYFLSAQRQTGGIGSGALGGVRQLEAASAVRPRTAASAGAGPYAGEASTRYFHRGQGRFGVGAASYFDRTAPRTGR